jgi:hypothetical protein
VISKPPTPGTAGLLLTVDLRQGAAARNRDHHHASRAGLARQLLQAEPQGVAQDQLLEAQAGPEAQRA